MARCSIELTVSVAWWVRLYLHAVACVAALTRRQPDLEAVLATCMRGIRVRVA